MVRPRIPSRFLCKCRCRFNQPEITQNIRFLNELKTKPADNPDSGYLKYFKWCTLLFVPIIPLVVAGLEFVAYRVSVFKCAFYLDRFVFTYKCII